MESFHGKTSSQIIQSPDVYRKRTSFSVIHRYTYSLFLFTYSDFKVVILPHAICGILLAATSDLLASDMPPNYADILKRVPYVLLWNWFNILVFTLANQQRPESIVEDSYNKAWRPIPSGLISPSEARGLLFGMIPFVMVVSYYIKGFVETMLIFILTWMYNDLDGHNHYGTRNSLIGIAFVVHSMGSTRVAANVSTTAELFTPVASMWMIIIALATTTTIHVQDLPDVEGDLKRNRNTLPLIMGDNISRNSIAGGVVTWSAVSLIFWELQKSWLCMALVLVPAVSIAWRTLRLRQVDADERTYKLWCLWLVIIYTLPFVETMRRSI